MADLHSQTADFNFESLTDCELLPWEVEPAPEVVKIPTEPAFAPISKLVEKNIRPCFERPAPKTIFVKLYEFFSRKMGIQHKIKDQYEININLLFFVLTFTIYTGKKGTEQNEQYRKSIASFINNSAFLNNLKNLSNEVRRYLNRSSFSLFPKMDRINKNRALDFEMIGIS